VIRRAVEHVHKYVDVGISRYFITSNCPLDHRAMLISRRLHDPLAPRDREIEIGLRFGD
jgi:hypothetical protein